MASTYDLFVVNIDLSIVVFVAINPSILTSVIIEIISSLCHTKIWGNFGNIGLWVDIKVISFFNILKSSVKGPLS